MNDATEPLNQAHDTVNGGTHVIGSETPDEVVKGRRGGADAQEERDFDEYEREAGETVPSRQPSVKNGFCY